MACSTELRKNRGQLPAPYRHRNLRVAVATVFFDCYPAVCTGLFSSVVNIVFVVKHSNIVLSIISYLHVVSFIFRPFKCSYLTSGSLTRLVYQVFSDCQYQLLFFCLNL